MAWLVFSYSLSSKINSRHRVSLWRRLRRFGAVAPKTGVYVLPDREECLESFQWLAQEVQQARGEALVMKVEKFEGLRDSQLIEYFQNACKKEYEELDREIGKLEKQIKKEAGRKTAWLRERAVKLERRFSEIVATDFFSSPKSKQVANRLKSIEGELASSKAAVESLPAASISEYQNKTWVTRPRPHVDRLGCIWLLRNFIDKGARIRYSNSYKKREIPFDMRGVLLGHHEGLCSFEVMVRIFKLNTPGLKAIADIIHEIDLRDGKRMRAEVEGVAAVLKGWLLRQFSDEELEARGMALFDGLYNALNRT